MPSTRSKKNNKNNKSKKNFQQGGGGYLVNFLRKQKIYQILRDKISLQAPKPTMLVLINQKNGLKKKNNILSKYKRREKKKINYKVQKIKNIVSYYLN